ncbi:DJ-1/PfpI family protein [Shumkonia mesophila]|uniref:DJ-1/PfpI family protein n=1 Tax=Shumkonia mesophila TaxID=2838854 RepID=UPI0029345CE0|nr:DJ-1/PfpI family protein [Shumkonia mesophila]
MAGAPRTVGIYVYDEVEVLDFAGPFEVFSVAARLALRTAPTEPPPFSVVTISRTGQPIAARGGLVVVPACAIDAHPGLDLLIVPGGVVDGELRTDVIEWISRQAGRAEIVASVCTGAFLLAAAGLLRGLRATTHWEDAADLAARHPETAVIEDVGWVDEGRIVTSAGISAGIDMSLYLVERLLGRPAAERTARQMEYRRRP